MNSTCPFCNKVIEGSPINKSEASLLRSSCKIYYSLIVPIPFVGSYLGGKMYDLFSSSDKWYYRFVCPNCHCSWVSMNNESEIKVGGNNHIITFFCRNALVIGSVENDCYIMQNEENGKLKTTVVAKEDTLLIENYFNGVSDKRGKTFGKKIISQGLYLGELVSNVSNGWGICFHNNGFMWYGKWFDGKKNGIGHECDFDGKNYKAGYWHLDKFII